MKDKKTATRLKKLMSERGLNQIDILNKSLPYCKKYGVSMTKPDISQYVSGKIKPSQEKLVILGMALNVSEAWLMGFDVPRTRSIDASEDTTDSLDTDVRELLSDFMDLPKETKDTGAAPFTLGILNSDRLHNIGWQPQYSLKEGLMRTVQYLENK